MNIVKLHQLIDQWAAEERAAEQTDAEQPANVSSMEEATPHVPAVIDGKRVVRTKTSGDRVYMLDEKAKTRQWVTTGDILTALGFSMADVSEIDEAEFMKYGMGPAIYKLPDAVA